MVAMIGLDSDQAKLGLSLGWKKSELIYAHKFASEHLLGATHINEFAVILNDRYLAYRGSDLMMLHRALYPSEEVLAHPTICYADGSGTTAQKIAGAGVVVCEPGRQPLYFSENIGAGSNNFAELTAVQIALKAIPDMTRRVLIRTDSEYAIGSCTLTWTAKVNVGLIQNIREDIRLRGTSTFPKPHPVSFEHVAGHSGVEFNEIADRLANVGRKLITKVSL